MPTDLTVLRKKLFQECSSYIEKRIKDIQEAINSATESANDDTKSTAGDKHETGRAMAQLEQEKNMRQLSESLALRERLKKIDPLESTINAAMGSVIITDQFNFYLAVSAGKLIVDGKEYLSVSPESPIGQHLIGKVKGDHFMFNDKTFKIIKIG